MTALRPVARMVVLLALLVVVNFLLPRALPGDPLSVAVGGAGEDLPFPLTPEARAQLVDYYALDRPLAEQFTRYAAALSRADLGASMASGRPVGDLIAARIPWSLLLGGGALALAATVGALLGLRAAWAGGARDRALTGVLVFLGALPEFVIGLVLVVAFAVALPLFPARGATSPFIECAGPLGVLRCTFDVAAHLALPLAALTLAHLPGFYLVMRAATLAQLPQGYIAAARAKGLSETQVALRHAARNALGPFLALFGARLGFVLGGVIIVESVFAYPGLGQLAFDAVLARDYPVLQAVFLLAGAAVVLGNAAADLAIERIDPRLRAVRLA